MLKADFRNMADDETEISRAYQRGKIAPAIQFAAIVGTSYFGMNAALAVAAFVAIYLINDVINHLHDIAIRISRTNELLVDGSDERRWRKQESVTQ